MKTTAFFLSLLLYGFSFSVGAENFQFKRIDHTQGLYANYINRIYHQPAGYVWISTEQGAFRYDGENFLNYSTNSDHGAKLSDNFVTDIVQDGNGNIWIATEVGLNRLSPSGQVTIYTGPGSQGLTDNWIKMLFVDSNATLWVGTGLGLHRYQPELDKFQYIPIRDEQGQHLNDADVTAIGEDRNGNIWVGTYYGLTRLSDDQQSLQVTLSRDPAISEVLYDYILSIYQTPDGTLWLGTQSFGLFAIAPDGTIKIDLLPPEVIRKDSYNSVYSIARADDQHLWLGTESGLLRYAIDTGEAVSLQHRQYDNTSIPADSVYQVAPDNAGGLWTATSEGLAYHSDLQSPVRIFQQSPHHDGLSHNSVSSIFKHNDTLIIGTSDGIDKIALSTFDIDKKLADLPTHSYDITETPDGKLWFAHSGGISVLDPARNNVTHFNNAPDNPHGLPTNDIFTVTATKNNQVWLTTYGEGVYLFDAHAGVVQRYFDNYDNEYAKSGNFTYDAIIDEREHLWLATTHSVFRIDPHSGEHYHYPLNDQGLTVRVTGMTRDSQGVFWLTTNGWGLYSLEVDPNNSTAVTKRRWQFETMQQDAILNSIVKDDQDNIWITSALSLYRLDKNRTSLTAYNSLILDPALVFSEAIIEMVENRLFIASNRGLVMIETDELVRNEHHPNVQISSIRSGNSILPSLSFDTDTAELVFPYENNSMEFSFTALDFVRPELRQFQYRLAGFEQDWSSPSHEPKAVYTNLPAGDYRFQVKATNSDGVWSDNQIDLPISISPPWWFYVLSMLIVLVLVLAIFLLMSRRKRVKTLKRRANQDALTDLANRYRFNERLAGLVADKQQIFAIMYFDLDGFKAINDTHGHDIGDMLIIKTGELLSAQVRNQDLLARLSGDEFAIIFVDYGSEQNLELIGKRILNQLNEGFQIAEHWIKGSASIGIARYPEDGHTSLELMKNADIAMYTSKQNGRNQACFFQPEFGAKISEKMYLTTDLRRAIKDQEFSLVYQPKMHLGTERIAGFEALVRWHHPERGFVSPELFIPLAENSGLINTLGEWILDQACYQAAIWHRSGHLSGTMSVNFSAIQIMQTGVVELVKSTLAKHALPAKKLEIELTETLFIEHKNSAVEVLHRLRQLGVRISLDDFGTGYSSLSYLSSLPIDTLKIDRQFIWDLEKDKTSALVLKNIFNLAKDLDKTIVAEGVETKSQLRWLQQVNCQLAQGYYFYPPQSVEQLNTIMSKSSEHSYTDSLSVLPA